MSLCYLVAITVLLYILTGLNLKKLFCDVWYAISIILTCRKSEDTVHKATKKDGEQMLLVQHILFYYSYISP